MPSIELSTVSALETIVPEVLAVGYTLHVRIGEFIFNNICHIPTNRPEVCPFGFPLMHRLASFSLLCAQFQLWQTKWLWSVYDWFHTPFQHEWCIPMICPKCIQNARTIPCTMTMMNCALRRFLHHRCTQQIYMIAGRPHMWIQCVLWYQAWNDGKKQWLPIVSKTVFETFRYLEVSKWIGWGPKTEQYHLWIPNSEIGQKNPKVRNWPKNNRLATLEMRCWWNGGGGSDCFMDVVVLMDAMVMWW